ncbi:MAG: hypothetical protein AB9873_18380 [Syntrophobacteraceae bacterium]
MKKPAKRKSLFRRDRQVDITARQEAAVINQILKEKPYCKFCWNRASTVETTPAVIIEGSVVAHYIPMCETCHREGRHKDPEVMKRMIVASLKLQRREVYVSRTGSMSPRQTLMDARRPRRFIFS